MAGKVWKSVWHIFLGMLVIAFLFYGAVLTAKTEWQVIVPVLFAATLATWGYVSRYFIPDWKYYETIISSVLTLGLYFGLLYQDGQVGFNANDLMNWLMLLGGAIAFSVSGAAIGQAMRILKKKEKMEEGSDRKDE